MNSPRLRALATGRFGHTATVMAMSGVMLVGTAGAALASVGTEPGGVTLSPATGPKSLQANWSAGPCNTGFQGSAQFFAVADDGTTYPIAPIVTVVTMPFGGLLPETMAQIQAVGAIPDGSSQELVVICYSGPAATGASDPEMDTWVSYNADSTYTTSATQPEPVGEIGGIALAGLAAIGLGWMQFRRLRSRRQQPGAPALT